MWDLWSKASFQSIYPELCSFIICHCETSVFLIPVCRSAGSRWSTFCPTDNKCRKHNWTWTNTHISLRPAHITPDRETERVAELTGWVSLWSRPWWRSRRPDTHNTNSRSYRSQTLRKHIERDRESAQKIQITISQFILQHTNEIKQRFLNLCSDVIKIPKVRDLIINISHQMFSV